MPSPGPSAMLLPSIIILTLRLARSLLIGHGAQMGTRSWQQLVNYLTLRSIAGCKRLSEAKPWNARWIFSLPNALGGFSRRVLKDPRHDPALLGRHARSKSQIHLFAIFDRTIALVLCHFLNTFSQSIHCLQIRLARDDPT